MPSFEDLFGEPLTYDPVDPNNDTPPSPRLKGNTFDEVFGVGGGDTQLPDESFGTKGFDEVFGGRRRLNPPAKDEGSFVGDITRDLASGTVKAGALALGAVEYGARQAAGDEGTFGQYILGQAVDPLSSARRATEQYGEEILAGMSQESEDLITREWTTLDPDRSIWTQGVGGVTKAVALKMAQALPATILTLLPAVRLFKAGMTPGAIAYLGGSEGALSMGGIANGVASEIESMTHQELQDESPAYQGFIAQGLNEADARNQLITQAQGAVPLIGGVLVGSIAATAGRWLEPIIIGKGSNLAGRFGRGTVVEAAQEAPQSGAEQFMQNVAAQIYDSDRQLSEGVVEATVEGGIIGGLTGGAFTGVMGARPQRPTGQAPEQAPDPTEDFPEAEPTDLSSALVPVGDPMGQIDLPLTRRERGFPRAPIPPGQEPGPAPPDYAPDLTQPGGPQDPRQGDMFDPVAAGDTTTEPLGDIEAQVMEMQRPESGKDAVFLSAGSIAHLQKSGDLEAFLDTGVPLTNFDGVGGLLLAKDRQAAEGFAEDRNTGGDVERIIGLATGAGVGKPEGATTVVQRRDELGNIVQERVVADEDEALLIEAQWEQKHPNFDVTIRDAVAAQNRRGERVLQEETKAQAQRDEQQLAQALQEERSDTEQEFDVATRFLDEDTRARTTGAQTPTRAAARLVGEATRQSGERQRIGGFYPPEVLSFKSPTAKKKYNAAFTELVDQELTIKQEELAREDWPRGVRPKHLKGGTGKVTQRLSAAGNKARSRRTALLHELGEIRAKAKPTRTKAANIIEAARELSPATVEGAARGVEATKQREDTPAAAALPNTEALGSLTDSKIHSLTGAALAKTFKQAATWMSGRWIALQLEYEGGPKTLENIPEGAELLAISVPNLKEKQEDWKLTELKKIKPPKGMKGVWVGYTLQQGDNKDTIVTGTRVGTVKAARVSLKLLVDEKNETIKNKNTKGVEEGLTIERLSQGYSTKSAQRKLIRRVRNLIVSGRHGGWSKSKKITASIKVTQQKLEVDTGVLRRRGKFDVTVLGHEIFKQDEAKEARLKRVAKSKRLRANLDKTIRRAAKHLAKMNTGKFADLLNEREDGSLTDGARDLIHGKAYFRVIAEFATSLVRSKNTNRLVNEEMDKVDQFLKHAIGLPAADFARVFGRLLRAESQTQIRAIEGWTDATKSSIANPAVREKKNAEATDRLLAAVAQVHRMEHFWKTNSYYNNIVAPLVHKFANSTASDGWPSYQPTEEELQQVQWVMKGWDIPRLRKDMYTPLRNFFRTAGLEFTPRKKDGTGGELIIPYNEEGKYDYSPGAFALESKFKKRFGSAEDTRWGGIWDDVARQTYDPQAAEDARESAMKSADERSELGTFTRHAQANRVIEDFRTFISNPKTTIPGMIRAEERLIRVFKELGMWRDTPSSKMGRIMFGTPRTHRIVGPRLASKEIRKDEARKLLLASVKTQPLPKAWRSDEAIQLAAAAELRAETEMFLEATDPGPSITQFRDTGAAIQNKLDDISNPIKMNEILDMVVTGIPESHMYHTLAKRIRALNLDDVTVGWDWRNQIRSKQTVAQAKWEADPQSPDGQFRYIIVKKSAVNSRVLSREPAAVMLHAFLHEATHMATIGRIDSDSRLRQSMGMLKKITERHHRANETGKVPYGLSALNINEFVTEAFSNPQFQQYLKRVKLDHQQQTAWKKFVGMVKNILGLDSDRYATMPRNVLEAVMELTDTLFTGVARPNVTQPRWLNLDDVADPVMKPIAEAVVGDVVSRFQGMKKAWDEAKKGGIRAPLHLMSMRQIHYEFQRFFGEGKGNALTKYKEAWERRDSENSRLMHIGELLSTVWTGLTEKGGVASGLTFSRVATEASLYMIHPNLPLDHELNSHVTSEEQKTKHAELARRFNAMSPGWQSLWKKVQAYYSDALADETALIMINALRGVISRGTHSIMNRDEFDAKYTQESVAALKLDTKEGIRKEFPDLADTQVSILATLGSIPTQRRGPYFPMMRYGDYLVYSKQETEAKRFTDRKAAHAYANQRLAEDPTLDAVVRDTGETEWTVVVTEKDFRMAETASEAERMRQEMVGLYGEDATSSVQLRHKFKTQDTVTSNSALDQILKSLDGNAKAQSAIKNWWLQNLSDSSFRKHEIKRKNRRGVDYESQHRNFTNYVKKSAYYRSQLKYGRDMADGMQDIVDYVADYKDTAGSDGTTNVRLGQVRNHLQKRDSFLNDLSEPSKLIRRGTEVGQLMMLFGPSYWMINASQPYVVTLPWLAAQYGWGGAMASLKNAQALIIHPLAKATKDSLGGLKALTSKEAAEKAFNVVDQVKEIITKRAGDRASAYNDMLEQLRQVSIIDLSWIAELRDISEGRDTGKWQKTIDATRVMGHLTEVNNRILTAIAAYDLMYNKQVGEGLNHDDAHAAGVDFAKQATSTTHFDYSAGNKPLLFQPSGPLGRASPLFFQFLQWPQHMYAMMISNMVAMVNAGTIDRKTAAKRFAFLLGTHTAVGGLIGAALQPIKWAVGAALYAFGDDDDIDTLQTVVSGETFDRWMREAATEKLGAKAGHALASGLPAALLDVDLSSRMSLGTVYYLDLKTDTAESTLGSIAAGLGGPWINIGMGAARGLPMMGRGLFQGTGEFQRGFEYFLPKAFKDISKTIRYSTEGLVNNAGDTVMQTEGISGQQLFLQSLGFRPAEIADFYSRQALIKDTERFGKERASSLLKRFRTATSGEQRSGIMREIAAFNQVFKATPITRSSLLRAVKGKREREASYRRRGVALKGRAIMLSRKGEYYE